MIFGVTCGVIMNTSAFLACYQCWSACSSLGWGFNFKGVSMWHFLKLVIRGVLRVLWIPPLLHWLMVSANTINLNICDSALSDLIAELSLRTMWRTTCCRWWTLSALQVISARLGPGHWSVPVADSLQRSEEIGKKSWIAPFSAIIFIIYYYNANIC